MAGIDKDLTNIILHAWSREFDQFGPVTKFLYARLNGFVMTGIEFHSLPSPTTYYYVRVFVSSFNHEDTETLWFDCTGDFLYSLGQHRLGTVKYLGNIEEFPDFCNRLRRETVLADDLSISKLIAFFETRGSSRSRQGVHAMALAYFYRDGLDAARAFLDSKGPVRFVETPQRRSFDHLGRLARTRPAISGSRPGRGAQGELSEHNEEACVFKDYGIAAR